MRLLHLCLITGAAALLTTAAHGQTGYWQYLRTESHINSYDKGTAYPDTYLGGEGALSVTVTEPSVNPPPTLGVTFFWSRPPAIMIPGTPIYWPVSARI